MITLILLYMRMTNAKTGQGIPKELHANPVRRGLVEKPEEWEWSSAGWNLGQRPVKIEMDAVATQALLLDGTWLHRNANRNYGF